MPLTNRGLSKPLWKLNSNNIFDTASVKKDLAGATSCPANFPPSLYKTLWKVRSLLNWNNTLIDVNSLVKDICSLDIKTQKGLITFNTIAVLLWKIWLERNSRVFKQKKKEVQDLWEDILAQTAGVMRVIRGCPPSGDAGMHPTDPSWEGGECDGECDGDGDGGNGGNSQMGLREMRKGGRR
ncbi:LINE-1 retrotransposable element ORF2 protein [Cucumis melo var. makuwa]|uniref:LINE-1 retrotransposable element ORF2 protein n=1 Tax=Cucumis melo var. makuwa TaxID=1194695 RepID=A0A5A7V9L0_CUCMM|nr:LINE-1 retrotransposable element ORF2 protein [Cucumis melo var. makuwa]